MPTKCKKKQKKKTQKLKQPMTNIHVHQGDCLEMQPEPAICFAPVVLAHFPQHLFCRSSLGACKEARAHSPLKRARVPIGAPSSVPRSPAKAKVPNVVSSSHSNFSQLLRQQSGCFALVLFSSNPPLTEFLRRRSF